MELSPEERQRIFEEEKAKLETKKKSEPPSWLVIVLLIFFAPVGIVLTWLKKGWNIGLKIAITAIFGILFLIGIVNMGTSGKTNQASTTATNTAQEPQVKTVKLNQPIQVGEVKWVVTKFEQMTSIPSDNEFIKPAKAAGKFIKVTLTAELLGKESGTIDSNQLKLMDSQNRKFEVTQNTDVSMILGDKWLFLKQVNPNVPVSGIAIFDVAKDAKGFKLEIGDLRFGSDEKGYVKL